MNPNDEIADIITVIKIALNGDNTEPCYLMIGWLHHAFEMHLYLSDGSVWKGHFSTNRLNGFCKNLHLSRDEYFKRIRQSLSNEDSGYRYELKSGFFYWKLKLTDAMLLEGFLPVERLRCTKPLHSDVLDVLLASNKRLREKILSLQNKYDSMKADFGRSLKDTEEFLQLKIEMETSLCEKFMNLINMKKVKLNEIGSNSDKAKAKLTEEPSK